MGHWPGVARVLVSNSGSDAASRAALRLLMERLPGVSAIEGGSALELATPGEPATLRAAQIVEGGALCAVKIPGISRQMTSSFGAFLDGAQRVQVIGRHGPVPLVLGTVSAAVRIRVNRRLITWGHQPPRVERRIYLPLRYLPPLAELREANPGIAAAGFQIVDTSTADRNGDYPSRHPAALLEKATRAVDQHRDQLEDRLAEAWCALGEAPLFVDGGISRSKSVATSSRAIGVIKSHRTLYVEDDGLPIVLGLAQGERSSVFRVTPRSRSAVLSWYLRLRSADGHDPMWGLVRVEMSECDSPTKRADEISRWVLAETAPLALPDGRWDKMSYGVRDCEEFLRAIS